MMFLVVPEMPLGGPEGLFQVVLAWRPTLLASAGLRMVHRSDWKKLPVKPDVVSGDWESLAAFAGHSEAH